MPPSASRKVDELVIAVHRETYIHLQHFVLDPASATGPQGADGVNHLLDTLWAHQLLIVARCCLQRACNVSDSSPRQLDGSLVS